MSKKGRFTQLKAGRRRAYLKAQPVRYNPDVRRLLDAHPDRLRPSKPLIEKVLDKDGKPIEKHAYIAPQRNDTPRFQVLLDDDDWRYHYYLCMQGSMYWITRLDTVRGKVTISLNFGSGELAKAAWQRGEVRWMD